MREHLEYHSTFTLSTEALQGNESVKASYGRVTHYTIQSTATLGLIILFSFV